MTDDAQSPISVFTEIDDRIFIAPVRAFFRAGLHGALWGGGPFLLLSVPIGGGLLLDGEPAGILLLFAPLLIAGCGTLAGMLLIGLPLTVLLKHLQREGAATYQLAGLLGGALLPLAAVALGPTDWGIGLFLALLGMLAGHAAGRIWGEWREDLASPTGRMPNRFHEMIF